MGCAQDCPPRGPHGHRPGASRAWYRLLLDAEPVIDEDVPGLPGHHKGFHHTIFELSSGVVLALHAQPTAARVNVSPMFCQLGAKARGPGWRHDWYQEHHRKRRRPGTTRRLDERLTAGITVADVGCGLGTSTPLLGRVYQDSAIHGFDPHQHSIELAARRPPTVAWPTGGASCALGAQETPHEKGGSQMRDELTVLIVGAFTVRRGSSVLAGADIGSRKARLLLGLLAVERGHWVSTDRITDALWPDRAPRRPAQNVATLVSRLRQRLGPDLVEGGTTMYRLGGQVAVDLYDAADLVNKAERAKESGVALLAAMQALDLLEHGDVLGGEPHAKWPEPAREQRTMLVRRGRLAAANRALQAGELCVARYAAERAVADDAFDEAAHRTLMVVHMASGEPARALLAYERLRVTLADELGTGPTTATRDLHVDILRNGQSGTSSIQPRVSSAVSIGTKST